MESGIQIFEKAILIGFWKWDVGKEDLSLLE